MANPQVPAAPTPGLEEIETAIVVRVDDPAEVRRWALGEAAVTWDGETWTTGNLLRLGDAEDALSAVDARLEIGFLSTADEPVDYRIDPGPLQVTVSWLARTAGSGDPWEEVHRELGRFSGLTRSGDGSYSAEIEAEQSRIAGQIGRMWSNEDQTARFPGDRGFEFLARLAAGYPVNWPPEQGGRGIGTVPAAAPAPEVPEQVTPHDGAILIPGNPTEIDALGTLSANLYDPDQPLDNIVWRWERRDDPADQTVETIPGSGAAGSSRAMYGIQAGDVGKQVRALAVYDDAKGPNRQAVSAWVGVTAPEVPPGPPQDAPVLILWLRTTRSGGLYDWTAGWESVPGAAAYQTEVRWATETEAFPRREQRTVTLSSARTFRVRAWNEHGFGPWSAWASTTAALTRLPLPGMVSGLEAQRTIYRGTDYWELTWTAASLAGTGTGGGAAYEVQSWVGPPPADLSEGSNRFSRGHVSTIGARIAVQVRGLRPTHAAVRAFNITGYGPWSDVLVLGT